MLGHTNKCLCEYELNEEPDSPPPARAWMATKGKEEQQGCLKEREISSRLFCVEEREK
jgi:hypothetical protein